MLGSTNTGLKNMIKDKLEHLTTCILNSTLELTRAIDGIKEDILYSGQAAISARDAAKEAVRVLKRIEAENIYDIGTSPDVKVALIKTYRGGVCELYIDGSRVDINESDELSLSIDADGRVRYSISNY